MFALLWSSLVVPVCHWLSYLGCDALFTFSLQRRVAFASTLIHDPSHTLPDCCSTQEASIQCLHFCGRHLSSLLVVTGRHCSSIFLEEAGSAVSQPPEIKIVTCRRCRHFGRHCSHLSSLVVTHRRLSSLSPLVVTVVTCRHLSSQSSLVVTVVTCRHRRHLSSLVTVVTCRHLSPLLVVTGRHFSSIFIEEAGSAVSQPPQ